MICAKCSRTFYGRARVNILPDGSGVTFCRDCREDVILKRHFRFENMVLDNLDNDPVEVTSFRHLEEIMERNCLVERPREHIDDLNHRRWQKGMAPIKE